MFNYTVGCDVDKLKEEVERLKTKIVDRDKINGNQMAINAELIIQVEELKEELCEKKTQHDGKAMMALDVQKQVIELKCEKNSLEAELGRKNMEAALTWQDALARYLDDVVQKKLIDRMEDLNYWSDNE